MSGYELHAVEGDAVIAVPVGKTIIGRGPFLQVTDKRVSRSHAILEVIDGKLYLTPTHSNPCFYVKQKTSVQDVLPKNTAQCLGSGDQFGLLPDHLFFDVFGPAVHNGTQKQKTEVKTNKTTKPPSTDKTADIDDDWDKVNDEIDEFKKETKQTNKKVSKPTTVKPPGQKEMAVPLQKTRPLPAWLTAAAAAGGPQVKKKPMPKKIPAKKTAATTNKRRDLSESEEEIISPTKQIGRSKKKAVVESDLDDEMEAVVPPAKKRGPKKKKPKMADSEDESISDGGDLDSRKRGKRETMLAKSKRTPRAASLKGSYNDEDSDEFEYDEDLVPIPVETKDDDDSDFVIDEDSGSEWEETSHRVKRGRKVTKVSPRKKPGRKAKRKYDSDDDDDDDDFDDDFDDYIPRPSKRRASSMNSPKAKPAKKTHRPPCPYGKKCYRKNPKHFNDESHPGDDSYGEESEESASESDDKPECEFGTDCKRMNQKHRNDYNHTQKPEKKETKREAKRPQDMKSVLNEASDDDGLANTYDYNDSFIDDIKDSESSESFSDPGDDGSDYEPPTQASEDVNALLKEAKGFIKNKKMQKTVRSKH